MADGLDVSALVLQKLQDLRGGAEAERPKPSGSRDTG